MEERSPDRERGMDRLVDNQPSAGNIISEHVVEEKDTLSDIARKYKLSIDEIMAVNQDLAADHSNLSPGTKLMIPNKLHD